MLLGGQERVEDNEWHTNRLLVHQPLARHAALTEEEAVVRREDDQRAAFQFLFAQDGANAADFAVDAGDEAVVIAARFADTSLA